MRKYSWRGVEMSSETWRPESPTTNTSVNKEKFHFSSTRFCWGWIIFALNIQYVIRPWVERLRKAGKMVFAWVEALASGWAAESRYLIVRHQAVCDGEEGMQSHAHPHANRNTTIFYEYENFCSVFLTFSQKRWVVVWPGSQRRWYRRGGVSIFEGEVQYIQEIQCISISVKDFM